MKALLRGLCAAFGIGLGAGMLLMLLWVYSPSTVAQSLGAVMLTGGSGLTGAFGRPVAAPAYLKPTHISTNTSTSIKTSVGVLAAITVNKGGSNNTVTVYNTPGPVAVTGTELAVIDSANPNFFPYGMIFSGGLLVVTSGGVPADITVLWR